ncbi:hypothetical protein PAMP_023620 [Pampus punctatissimus]
MALMDKHKQVKRQRLDRICEVYPVMDGIVHMCDFPGKASILSCGVSRVLQIRHNGELKWREQSGGVSGDG